MTAQEQSSSPQHDNFPSKPPPDSPIKQQEVNGIPDQAPAKVNGVHQPQDSSTSASRISNGRKEDNQMPSGTATSKPPDSVQDTSNSPKSTTAVIAEPSPRTVDEKQPALRSENGSAAPGSSSTRDPPGNTSSQEKPSNGTHPAPVASIKKSKPSSSQHKPSFLVKLVLKLVPCVGPSKAHETQPEAPIQPEHTTPKEKAKEVESSPPQEISPAPPKDTEAEKNLSPLTSELTESSKAVLASPPPPISITPPPSTPADADIIVPPTPTTQLLPDDETGGVTAGAVQPPGSTGGSGTTVHHEHKKRDSTIATNGVGDGEESEATTFETDEELDETRNEEMEDEEDSLILRGGAGIPIGPDGVPKPLLPPIAPQHVGRKCLVLDLDETLVHSSFKSIQQADYVVPVEIEYHWHNVYVIKRPGVDNFLKKMGEIYEVVVFTASLSKYADPVLDKLDVHQVVSHRLFRESCYNHKGNYVKDLSQLGRPIGDTIILDNSPASYIFHPNNAVPVSSWFNDPHDTELTDLVPFLTDLSAVDDVRGVLDGAR